MRLASEPQLVESPGAELDLGTGALLRFREESVDFSAGAASLTFMEANNEFNTPAVTVMISEQTGFAANVCAGHRAFAEAAGTWYEDATADVSGRVCGACEVAAARRENQLRLMGVA